MIYYTGTRSESGISVLVESDDGIGPLWSCKEIVNLAPDTGEVFEWGYNGKAPAQLALALCIDALECDCPRALRVYQLFKERYIAPIDAEGWTMTRDEVRRGILFIEAELGLRSGVHEC